MLKSLFSAALTGALLAAPAAVIAADFASKAGDIVKAANWEKMETLTVELDEHSFAPQDLKLKAGQPYKLVIRNIGEKDHYYTAAEFFQSVAWRKAQTPRPNGGEIKAPYFTAVEAYKDGGVVELFFVPMNTGTFEVVCTVEDHKEQGMKGTIAVE